jgi:hypothetical protein
MTAPTADAPTAGPAGGEGVDPGGQAPPASTSDPAGPGADSTGGSGRRRDTTERVRSASRDDDAPQDHTGDGDGTDDGDDTGKPGKPGKSDWKIDDLPPGAQKYISDLRKEAGTRRTEAAEAKKAADAAAQKAAAGDERFANATEAFMKALGLTPEPDEPERSPEDLLGEITTKYQQSRIELAVYRAAGAYEADPDALLDSRGFLSKAHALDLSADDFEDAIAEAIADAVDSNPKLRAAPAFEPAPAAPSGGDFGGGPAGRSGPDEWSVDDFRRNRNQGRGAP